MPLSSRSSKLIILTGILFLFSCNDQHNRAGVEAAMKHYDHLIKKLDADSISLLYTADGNLGDIAQGRDSIKRFLSSFTNVQVLSQASQTSSIELFGDSAIQKGTYQQNDERPPGIPEQQARCVGSGAGLFAVWF